MSKFIKIYSSIRCLPLSSKYTIHILKYFILFHLKSKRKGEIEGGKGKEKKILKINKPARSKR